MAGVSTGPESQAKLQPPTPPARPRMLRVEVNGLLHDWFDIDEMGQFVRSPTFSTTLRENIARYFGVPVKHQAIYDEDGLLTTSADFSRALQRFSPKLYIYDAHEMGDHLRERTSEQLALIDAEVEQSRKNFHMNNASKSRSATPRQRRGSRSEKRDGSQADGPHEGGAPEVTPVKAVQPEPLVPSRLVDPSTQPTVATLTASASSVETMNIGPAPVPGAEAEPCFFTATLVKAPVDVPVEAARPLEPAAAQARSGAHTPVPRAPDPAAAVPTREEQPLGARRSITAPQSGSVRALSQGASGVAAAGAPRVLRPSMSIRAPSLRAGGSTTVPVVVVATPPQGSPLQFATPLSSGQQQLHRHSLQGRPVQGAAAEPLHAAPRPMARSPSPQPAPGVVVARPATPVRVPSQLRLERPSAWQSPGVPPPWQSLQGCHQQHLRHPHAAQAPVMVRAAYSPVAISAPGQVPLAPQQLVQRPPQQLGMPAQAQAPEERLCRDGTPTREFVDSAGRFFGFVDQLQKRGCRKPRTGSEEGTRNMLRMQNAEKHGMFDGEVENIWE